MGANRSARSPCPQGFAIGVFPLAKLWVFVRKILVEILGYDGTQPSPLFFRSRKCLWRYGGSSDAALYLLDLRYNVA
jgi:hypothetical protein